MSNRTYTFTFDDEYMDVETTDGLLDEEQAATILYWFATEIKSYAPLTALSELHEMARKELLSQRGRGQ